MELVHWTYFSAILIAISGLRYMNLAWERKIEPNPVSWGVWATVGVALLLTAEASDAKEVFWSSALGAMNPAAVVMIILIRTKDRITHLNQHEKFCLCAALVGYGLWFLLKDTPETSQWSLYWMICVDIVAMYPTIEQVVKYPMSDKPASWMMFGIGYVIAGLAITEHTIANWVLPVYMFLGSWVIALPMVLARIKARVPLSQWW